MEQKLKNLCSFQDTLVYNMFYENEVKIKLIRIRKYLKDKPGKIHVL